MSNRPKAYLALMITTTIWGIAGPVIKYTLQFLPPFTFLFYRFLISSVAIFPFFIWYLRRHSIKTRDLPKLTLLAILATTVNLSLIFLGYDRTTALDGTLISALTPIFIVIGGALFLKETITSIEKLGLAIAVSGTTITIIQPLLEKAAFAQQNLAGNLLILASGIEWAAFTLIAKDDLKKHPPFLMTSWASFIGLATFIPLAFIENPYALSFTQINTILKTPSAFLGIAYMAIFSYLFAYFTYHLGLKLIEASEAALFSYLQPAFAAPLAVFWLGEKLTTPFLIGAAIIAIGVFLTEYKPRKRTSLSE
jgi:drug/metabolite transporter (DMT)-like permease